MKFIKRKNIDTYKPKSKRFTVEVDGRAIINTDKTLTVPIGDTASRPGTGVPGMLRYNTDFNDFEVYTGFSNWGWERLRTNRPSNIRREDVGVGQGDGSVDSVYVADGGSGYTTPTITFSPPDVGTDVATGTVNVVDGVIQSITMGNTGSGYLEVPSITITGDSTTPANLTAVLTGALEYALTVVPLDNQGNLSATNIQVYIENVFQIPGINYSLVQLGDTAYIKFDAPVPFGKPIYAIFGLD